MRNRNWFLVAVLLSVVATICCMPAKRKQQQHSAYDDAGQSYSNLIRELRDNWQSPIMYLQKRGYIPASSQPRSSFDVKLIAARPNEDEGVADEEVEEEEVAAAADNGLPSVGKVLKQRDNIFQSATLGSDSSASASPTVVSGSVLGGVGECPAKTAGFLSNMKDKFLGFFRGKTDAENMPKLTYKFDIDDFDRNFLQRTNFDINKDFSKESDKEFQKILEKGLDKELEKKREFSKSSRSPADNHNNKNLLATLRRYP